MSVEWGIVHRSNLDELHRGPMTERQAREWVQGWIQDGGNPDTFLLVHRQVSAWAGFLPVSVRRAVALEETKP